MALPTSGVITVSDILAEMGRPNVPVSIDDLAKLWLYKTRKQKFNYYPDIQLSVWYGEEWVNIYGYNSFYYNLLQQKEIEVFNDSIGTL